jgi:hypothetical protein
MAKVCIEQNGSVGELIRKMETDYTRGEITISEYVQFDMYATINKIEAYLNSKHTAGEFDSQDREKPFFNIVVAASNIWYRATDVDRKNIKIRPTKGKDTIDAFLATVYVQDWMTREQFGQFLNEWGRVLSRYGSAITEFVEKDGRLIASVPAWNRMICDPIDFESNPKIKVLELTEAQLRKNKNYDKEVIDGMCNAKTVRETLKKRRKDNKSDYFKVYELHGELPLSYLTGKDNDGEEYVQQMQVVSFLGTGKKNQNGREIFDDFTLYSGKEAEDPYMLTHLIKEDGRTLSIGAVEHLFEPQWMLNHTAKSIKDQLDIASKLIFQTADSSFVGRNALTEIEQGDILIYNVNMPLTQINNTSHDITSLQNFGAQWKSLANEIAGVSEAMLGAQPKSGTAWRQTEALLQESYSLFELMTENKGLDIENMFRKKVIPFIKKKMNHSKEISATLESYDLDKIDSKYIKNFSIQESNRILKEKILSGETPTPDDQAAMLQSIQQGAKDAMAQMGNQRFFKPSDISEKTWKEQFKDLEWEIEVDITGEAHDTQEALATLNTALQVVMNPLYAQNKQAQMIVGKILNKTSVLSPLELSTIPQPSPMQPTPVDGAQVNQPLAIK